MQAIANGSKHLSLDGPIDTASVHGAAFSQEFSRAFDISRLEIRFSNGQTRYFDVILDETVEWWRGVLEKLK